MNETPSVACAPGCAALTLRSCDATLITAELSRNHCPGADPSGVLPTPKRPSRQAASRSRPFLPAGQESVLGGKRRSLPRAATRAQKGGVQPFTVSLYLSKPYNFNLQTTG